MYNMLYNVNNIVLIENKYIQVKYKIETVVVIRMNSKSLVYSGVYIYIYDLTVQTVYHTLYLLYKI